MHIYLLLELKCVCFNYEVIEMHPRCGVLKLYHLITTYHSTNILSVIRYPEEDSEFFTSNARISVTVLIYSTSAVFSTILLHMQYNGLIKSELE